ncbi:hypothetical protein MUK42_36441 [Musa troglodytarum]|uniref:Uncharacterized protein n=1 Tax=Musa troglodytarum TaxID=320322 RepID=A0A9E7E991_9LILI|nr:hypothetical protein MUK42_36441 [Musa troglodytarum]
MISKPSTPSIPNRNPNIRRLTREELKKRSAKGLCWHCDEKWSKEHRCKQGKLLVIELIGEEPKADNVDFDYEDFVVVLGIEWLSTLGDMFLKGRRKSKVTVITSHRMERVFQKAALTTTPESQPITYTITKWRPYLLDQRVMMRCKYPMTEVLKEKLPYFNSKMQLNVKETFLHGLTPGKLKKLSRKRNHWGSRLF